MKIGISDRTLGRIGAGVAIFSFVTLLLSLWLVHFNPPTPQGVLEGGAIVMAMITYAVIGGILVYRQPRNVVGWLVLSVVFWGATNTLATEYARYGLFTEPGSLPLATFWAWYGAWSFQPVFSLPISLLIFYPNGRLLSRRWRWLVWLLVVSSIMSVVPYALAPKLELGQSSWNIHYPNPVGLPVSQDFMNSIVEFGLNILVFTLVVGLITVFIRYRRAERVERLQLKWFAFSAFTAFTIMIATGSVPVLSDVSFGIGLMVLPIAVAVAVLRYRLYEIDRIISRSLAYLLVVGLLLGSYLVVVLALSTLSPLAGDSPAVVALSTLTAAALFRPLVGRVRRVIDLRFNRARYDAARTLDGFARTLSLEIDIQALSNNLSQVVATTMEPAHVSLWLKPGRGPRP